MHRFLIAPDAKHSTYRGRYRIGDQPKIHEVTLHTTIKEVAMKRLKEIHEDAERESVGLIAPGFSRKALKRPLMEIFAEYLKSLSATNRSEGHIRVVRLRFRNLANGCKWSCMADVTNRSFIAWRDAQTKYEARTLNNFYETARGFFNWVDRRYEIPNPLKRVENLDVPVRYPQGPRAFSEEELEKLFAIANPYRRLIYRFLAFTGLRRIEAQRLQWGDLHLDDTTPGLFLRPEATKARRADWLPILPVLVPELEAARPVYWKPDTLVFRRGVTAPETLRKDMEAAGIPLVDKLGRPVGIHTFRRSFISHLQKRGVHSRVIMQLARHKSLSLTDWTYTDTTKLPLADGIASLTQMVGSASPLSSPLKSGQNGVLAVNVVQTEKTDFENRSTEIADSEEDCLALAGAVQTDENLDLVPGVGVEPTRYRYR
jgi:integrase